MESSDSETYLLFVQEVSRTCPSPLHQIWDIDTPCLAFYTGVGDPNSNSIDIFIAIILLTDPLSHPHNFFF